MKIIKILVALLMGALVAIQFVGIDKTAPDFNQENDLLTRKTPPAEMAQMLRNACYDCHSNETQWPWYSHFAPVNWMLEKHVIEGREKLNFSYWGEMEFEDRLFAVEEMIEEIEIGEMPMPGYVAMHKSAQLTDAQKQQFIDWLRSLQNIDE
jgi:hypothetical protein